MLRALENKIVKVVCALLGSLLLSVFAINGAMAHKVITSVYAVDDIVEGEIGFSNGKMAENVLVEIFGENGEKLGEATTDEEGFFTFRPTLRQALSFRADLSAGHIAQATLEADELPEGLAAVDGSAASSVSGSQEPVSKALAAAGAAGANLKGLEREIRNLRKDLAAFKEEKRMQDILGGIGFILGIFGIVAFFMSRRKA